MTTDSLSKRRVPDQMLPDLLDIPSDLDLMQQPMHLLHVVRLLPVHHTHISDTMINDLPHQWKADGRYIGSLLVPFHTTNREYLCFLLKKDSPSNCLTFFLERGLPSLNVIAGWNSHVGPLSDCPTLQLYASTTAVPYHAKQQHQSNHFQEALSGFELFRIKQKPNSAFARKTTQSVRLTPRGKRPFSPSHLCHPLKGIYASIPPCPGGCANMLLNLSWACSLIFCKHLQIQTLKMNCI